jgi:anthranilate/para-aminobenzoate synthase component I
VSGGRERFAQAGLVPHLDAVSACLLQLGSRRRAGDEKVGPARDARADPPAEGETIRVSEPRALTSKDEFLAMVARALDWIAAGDIYQVNLARHFVAEVRGGSLFPLYEALRTASPAPMAAWLALGGREILSSSPETFLRISARGIETRPIKGTRPRFADPAEDRRSAYELQTSAKEIAELVMITDLLRNDLGQVCEFGSVGVREMLQLETLEQVHHLVSTVTGIGGSFRTGVPAAYRRCPGGAAESGSKGVQRSTFRVAGCGLRLGQEATAAECGVSGRRWVAGIGHRNEQR